MDRAEPSELTAVDACRHVQGRTWRWALLAMGAVLAGCGGDIGEGAPLTQSPPPVALLRLTVLDPAGMPVSSAAAKNLVVCRPVAGTTCKRAYQDVGAQDAVDKVTFAWAAFGPWGGGARQVTVNLYDEVAGTWARNVVLDFTAGATSGPVRLVSFLGPDRPLQVTVTDAVGKPLRNAQLSRTVPLPERPDAPYAHYLQGDVRTGPDGQIVLDVPADSISLWVSHPLGYSATQILAVPAGGASASFTITPAPSISPTLALQPNGATDGSISADRKELDVRINIQTNSSYASFSGWDFWNPWRYSAGEGYVPFAGAMKFVQSSVPRRIAGPTEAGAYSALLLLDQSERITAADYYGMRYYAAHRFVARARSGAVADQVLVAGFAGAGAAASTPLLPQWPLWAPPGGGAAAVDSLESLTGGSAPVFDALDAAVELIAVQMPADRTRAVVAYLGGDDDSGLTVEQRRQRIDALRARLTATGVQLVLIAADWQDPARPAAAPGEMYVAELASALQATFIADGTDYLSSDPYSALELAADLLAGRAARWEAPMRFKLEGIDTFDPGTTWFLRGYLQAPYEGPMGGWAGVGMARLALRVP